MVRLAPDMLARRESGDPVPILASIASWKPAAQDLREFLYTQLVSDYPILAGELLPDAEVTTRAAALLDSGLIMPILGMGSMRSRRRPEARRSSKPRSPGEIASASKLLAEDQ